MKKIIVLIDEQTNLEVVIPTAVKLAKLLDLEITLCHLVFAPYNWEQLSRTIRDSHPNEKIKMNDARLLMDDILGKIRLENVKAKKQFLLYDIKKRPYETVFQENELVVMEKKFVCKSHDEKLIDFLLNLNSPKLFVDNALDMQSIADIVFTSNFHKIDTETAAILNDLYRFLEFNLNLVYINTTTQQENSEISIDNMKRAIATYGLSKTTISIFHSDYKIRGAELFADMKGGDLIIMECCNRVSLADVKSLKLPILLINPIDD